MRKKIRQKLKAKGGFSLAELLLSTLILLMVSTIIAQGIPSAKRAFTNIQDSANAQLLLSTAMTMMRDELAYARDIKISSDHTDITFKSDRVVYDLGDGVEESLPEYDRTTTLYGGDNASLPSITGALLISDGLYADKYHPGRDYFFIHFDEVEMKDNTITFSNFRVDRKDGKRMAQVETFDVNTLN